MNPSFQAHNVDTPLEVRMELVCEEAELDEQGLLVKNQTNAGCGMRLIMQPIQVIAYVFGKRKDTVFKELKSLLVPFKISHYYTDDWGDYERHLDKNEHEIGKRNAQKIERKNLNFRTWIKRLTRRTICFSKIEKCMIL